MSMGLTDDEFSLSIFISESFLLQTFIYFGPFGLMTIDAFNAFNGCFFLYQQLNGFSNSLKNASGSMFDAMRKIYY